MAKNVIKGNARVGVQISGAATGRGVPLDPKVAGGCAHGERGCRICAQYRKDRQATS